MPNNESNTSIEDRLVLNLTYHSLLRDFQKVLNKAQRRPTNKTIFGEKPPLICWCKARTLKDYLIRTKITNRHQKI